MGQMCLLDPVNKNVSRSLFVPFLSLYFFLRENRAELQESGSKTLISGLSKKKKPVIVTIYGGLFVEKQWRIVGSVARYSLNTHLRL